LRILLLVSALSILAPPDGWLTLKNKYANRKMANISYIACTSCTYIPDLAKCLFVLSQIALRLVGEGKGSITFYSRLFYPYGNT